MPTLPESIAPNAASGTPESVQAANGSPISSAVAEWVYRYADNVDEVLAFCQRHDLFGRAETALGLARDCFQSERLRAAIEADPEEEGEWLVFDIVAHGSSDEVLKAYDSFTRRWMAAAPCWQDRELIPLLYNFE
jgi:hypothetical protein